MPGKGVPTLNYKGAQSGSMSLRLFFDTTDTGQPVTTYTDRILSLMEIDASLPGTSDSTNNARPPWVQFHWGNMYSFQAVVTSASVAFTYFSSTGTPLRADVDLTLTQYQDGKIFGPQNPTSGTPHPHRAHRAEARGDARPDRCVALWQPNEMARHRRPQRHRGPHGPQARTGPSHPRAHLDHVPGHRIVLPTRTSCEAGWQRSGRKLASSAAGVQGRARAAHPGPGHAHLHRRRLQPLGGGHYPARHISGRFHARRER